MEVSGRVEGLCVRYINPIYDIYPEELIDKGVYKESEIKMEPDYIHYTRTLSTGLTATKRAFGTIR